MKQWLNLEPGNYVKLLKHLQAGFIHYCHIPKYSKDSLIVLNILHFLYAY